MEEVRPAIVGEVNLNIKFETCQLQKNFLPFLHYQKTDGGIKKKIVLLNNWRKNIFRQYFIGGYFIGGKSRKKVFLRSKLKNVWLVCQD